VSASGNDRPATYADALLSAKAALEASRELIAKGSIEAEAEQIVLHLVREQEGGDELLSRASLVERLSLPFPPKAGDRLWVLCGARAEGKPLQHLLGYQYFYSHEYRVSPDVLIPRPETEILVEAALARLRGERPRLGLEIGVGSGAISVELLADQPQLTMLASELKPEAATMARFNADRILKQGSGRLRLLEAAAGEALEPFAAALGGDLADFLVSNPPYLTPADGMEDEVRDHEPHAALFAPAGDPLFFYRRVAEGAAPLLRPLFQAAARNSACLRRNAVQRSSQGLAPAPCQGFACRIGGCKPCRQ
jgi:release factor glutamine methyltransferase